MKIELALVLAAIPFLLAALFADLYEPWTEREL